VRSIFSAHKPAGAASARHSLRPLFREGDISQSSGISFREKAEVCPRHCEERSDEAIHSAASGGMDCFASLAMTNISYIRVGTAVLDIG
jgi:hypothetical protein